ncbi:MFS transporter [Marmoricola endophyticus]|uniref:MFS transporter n=1 Tax=Marmoricola endophyticus TaxID=2040280 RepID=A0A917BFN7_9ACTN|nr:MFS transporter [Marmoricola endophyticus]GGF41865.1 MFS transporter [Marmoricola endophyticus]
MSEQTGLPISRGRATATLALLASIAVSLLMASSAPTPLYSVYQQEWAFGPLTTTVVFGVYAVAVLVALLVVGRVSDHVGRRPVLAVALLMQAVSMVVLIDATGVGLLAGARVVQGLATGAALGSIGAALLDVDRARGTLLNSAAPAVGTALGALVAGLMVQFLPAPTTLVYAVLLAVFVLQLAGVAWMRESVGRVPGGGRAALRSLRPEIAVPRRLRGPVLTATPVLLAVWALAGFYGSLSPTIVTTLAGHRSFVLGGLGLFILAGSGAVTVVLTRDVGATRVMTLGIGALVAGVALTQVAVGADSLVGFFVGTAVAGVGFGAGFQGGLRTVVPLTRPHERAGVLSVLYVVSYSAFGVPAVAAGALLARGGGLRTTSVEYAAAVAVLALLALAGLVRRRRRAALPAAAGCPEAA